MIICLHETPINKYCKVKEINCTDSINRRLMDLGIIKNTSITPIFRSPTLDSTAYEVRGSIIALRNCDAQNILVDFNN